LSADFTRRTLNRRAFLAGATLAASATLAGPLSARGRTPVGGRISLHVPWPFGALDPHRIDDPCAAIFGEALFDTLYAQAADGSIVAALAEADPEPEGATLRVKLRPGLRTARDRPLTTKDAAWSIGRARGMGARGWLADVPPPRDDGRSLVFATKDAARLVRALASPLVAIVPTTFSAESPDGTGPFRFGMRDGAMVLTRNRLAARGPAFLDEVVVRAAPNVAKSLLSFESGADDIGWFERGLHEPRAGSKGFDFGAVGWAVLFTGRDANDWDGTGIAQRICDGIPFTRVSNLRLGAPWTPDAEQGWGGPPAQLIVREDAPWLVDVANAVAATISRPSHEVTVRPVPATELAARRGSRMFALALDVVRTVAPGSLSAMVALATADNPVRAQEIVQHPPKLGDVAARTLTRTLRAGVVGEIRIVGGRIPELSLAPSSNGSGFDLGASFRARKP
jgi:peptide/nickel transport system substrate-binding protein